MNDQQFQDLVFRLETAISGIGSSQETSTQQLSEQLSSIANSIGEISQGGSASKNAAIFVDTLNRNFNFAAVRPPERPDQIGQNQVFIAGFSPAAASVLNRKSVTSGSNQNEIQELLSSLPIIGPVWGTMRSIVSFFMSPVNLATLGGMAVAFAGLKRFFSVTTNKEFFSGTVEDIYNLLTDTIGKIVSFFTPQDVSGEDVREKIKGIWDSIVGKIRDFFTKGIWNTYITGDGKESLRTAFKNAWTEDIRPAISKAFSSAMSKIKFDTGGISLTSLLDIEQEDIQAIVDNLKHSSSVSGLKEILKEQLDAITQILSPGEGGLSALGKAAFLESITAKLAPIIGEKIPQIEIAPINLKEAVMESLSDTNARAGIIEIIKEVGSISQNLSEFSTPITEEIKKQTTELSTAIKGIVIPPGGSAVVSRQENEPANYNYPDFESFSLLP